MPKTRGFTLIELLVSVVILGVLAAIVVPKYMNMQTEARIAAVNNLAGAVKSADAMISLAVVAKGLPSTSGTTTVYPNGGPGRRGDTTAVRIWNGHPDSQMDGIGNALAGANIGLHDGYRSSQTYPYGNFTARWTPNNVMWEYTTAPVPTNCKVNYLYGGGTPVISTVTSGC
jgi:MSHA pilin protein MshA